MGFQPGVNNYVPINVYAGVAEPLFAPIGTGGGGGTTGATGPTGTSGPPGTPGGPTGDTGPQGIPGTATETGATGPTGPAGTTNFPVGSEGAYLGYTGGVWASRTDPIVLGANSVGPAGSVVIGQSITATTPGVFMKSFNTGVGTDTITYNPTTSELTTFPITPAVQTVVAYAGLNLLNQYYLTIVSFYGNSQSPASVYQTAMFENYPDQYVSALVYNGLYYLLALANVGQGNTLFYRSANGVNWAVQPNPPGALTGIVGGLTWNSLAGYWIAVVNTTGETYISADGITWNTPALGPVGTGLNTQVGFTVYYPAGGINSTGVTFDYFGGQNFTTNGAALVYSINGAQTAYTAVNLPLGVNGYLNTYINAIAINSFGVNPAARPTLVIGIGSDSAPTSAAEAMLYSTDFGATFTPCTGIGPVNSLYISDIAYNGEIWVAVGQFWGTTAGAIYYSLNGISWGPALSYTSTPNDYFVSVSWNGYSFIVSSLYTTQTSLDGINWTSYSLYETDVTHKVAVNSFSRTKQVIWGGRSW